MRLHTVVTDFKVQIDIPPPPRRPVALHMGQPVLYLTCHQVWLILWILPALRTRAQFNSNNHLTGGNILHTVDKRGSDAKLGFLGKPGVRSKHPSTCMAWVSLSTKKNLETAFTTAFTKFVGPKGAYDLVVLLRDMYVAGVQDNAQWASLQGRGMTGHSAITAMVPGFLCCHALGPFVAHYF